MKKRALIPLIFVIATLFGSAYATSPQSKNSSNKIDVAKNNSPNSRGAELFATHCGRCHKPPEDLSPRVVPAVMAHMRTRAMLSQKDVQDILKFLEPQ